MKYTKIKLIKMAQNYYNKTGKPLIARKTKEHGISQTTVIRLFGKWSNFLLESNIPSYYQLKEKQNITKCKYCKCVFKKDHSKNIFCSHSCSAKFNNPKSKIKNGNYIGLYAQKECLECGKKHKKYKDIFCSGMCKLLNKNRNLTKIQTVNKNPRNQYTYIRDNARRVGKYLGFVECKICRYSKFIQVCHIKPVRDFNDSATLYEINHPSNIVPLCPNHHWEFDNGLINLNRGIV